jgi:hypothetical protein
MVLRNRVVYYYEADIPNRGNVKYFEKPNQGTKESHGKFSFEALIRGRIMAI